MKHIMDPPGLGEVELKSNGRDDPFDAERTLSSRRELIRLIGQGQVLRIKPHLIVDPEYLLDDVWGLRCFVDCRCSLRPFLFEEA